MSDNLTQYLNKLGVTAEEAFAFLQNKTAEEIAANTDKFPIKLLTDLMDDSGLYSPDLAAKIVKATVIKLGVDEFANSLIYADAGTAKNACTVCAKIALITCI